MNNDLIKLFVWAAIVGVIFAVLWRKGYLLRLSNYVIETREELRKCTWPTFEELKGSTIVVMITIALMGSFTVVADFVISRLVGLVT